MSGPSDGEVLRASSPISYQAMEPLSDSDLDAAMAALPPASVWAPSQITEKGQAGTRLSRKATADISDDLLKESAKASLNAKRCSSIYLNALRFVLGNQALAERRGFVLEMNQRVSFASPKVMRTIIGQMEEANLSYGRVVGLGSGRSQEVQCYVIRGGLHGSVGKSLEEMYRAAEGVGPYPANLHPTISDEDLEAAMLA